MPHIEAFLDHFSLPLPLLISKKEDCLNCSREDSIESHEAQAGKVELLPILHSSDVFYANNGRSIPHTAYTLKVPVKRKPQFKVKSVVNHSQHFRPTKLE
jgi:hypothetical protein